jgi:hypothetical protein
MAKYLGHEFESMGESEDDPHVKCKGCGMKSYHDSDDKRYYDFSGMTIITQSCKDFQEYKKGLTFEVE